MSAYRTAIRESQRLEDKQEALDAAWSRLDRLERVLVGQIARNERSRGWKPDQAVERARTRLALMKETGFV